MDIYWFKKAVSQFLHPIPVVLAMLALGIVLLVWSRWRYRRPAPAGVTALEDHSVPKKKGCVGSLGMLLVFGAMLVLYLCSTGLVANQMIFSLERQYPPLLLEEGKTRDLDPEYIVILAGAYQYKPQRPITSRFGEASMARLIEGIRIHKAYPEARVIMTGGVAKEGWPSVAGEMRDLAELLGLEAEVILEEESRDTKDHAKLLKSMLQDKQFILVTSGYHMPRAMGLFHGQGLNPIAASADLQRWPEKEYMHDQLIPGAKNLARVDAALHEYLGLVWAFFRGQLGSDPQDSNGEKKKDGDKSKVVDDREILVHSAESISSRLAIAAPVGHAVEFAAVEINRD